MALFFRLVFIAMSLFFCLIFASLRMCWSTYRWSFVLFVPVWHQFCSFRNVPCDCTESTNYNWYNRHFHVQQFFQFLSKVHILIFHFSFFQFHCGITRESKLHNSASSHFLLTIIRFGRRAEIRWSDCISKSQRTLYVSFFRTDSCLRT